MLASGQSSKKVSGLKPMELACDRLTHIFNELSKDLGAPPDIGRAASWIIEQRHPEMTGDERAILAEFSVAQAERIKRASRAVYESLRLLEREISSAVEVLRLPPRGVTASTNSCYLAEIAQHRVPKPVRVG